MLEMIGCWMGKYPQNCTAASDTLHGTSPITQCEHKHVNCYFMITVSSEITHYMTSEVIYRKQNTVVLNAAQRKASMWRLDS